MNEDKITNALLHLWNYERSYEWQDGQVRHIQPDVPVANALERIKQAITYPNRIYPDDVLPDMVNCYDEDENEVHSVVWYDPEDRCYAQWWDVTNNCPGVTAELTQIVRRGALRLEPKSS